MSSTSPSSASHELRGIIPLGAQTLELWLNGIYTCLVFATLYVFPRKPGASKLQIRFWTAIIVTMYLFATVHSTMTIIFEIRTFTFHGGDPSIVSAMNNQTRWFRGVGATMFVMTILIADCLIIWRCWIVWERSWTVCIIPILSTITGTVLSIISIVGQVEVAEKRIPGVVPKHFIKMSTPYFILSLVTSLYSTLAITLRVILVQWKTDSHSLEFGTKHRPRYSRMVEILVESVALNSINLIVFVILTVRKNGNLDWPQDIQPQIAGIAPTLILLRVALGHARPDSDWSTPTLRSIVFAHPSTHASSTTIVSEGFDDDIPRSGLEDPEMEKATDDTQRGGSSERADIC